MSTDEKLDEIISILKRIEDALEIGPNKEIKIIDFDSRLRDYLLFAINKLKLQKVTINNHKSAIASFLRHSKGIINKQTVSDYLESKESEDWKTNQTKALRRYIRDFLGLGKWIEEFRFYKSKVKLKFIPSDEQLLEFYRHLSPTVQLAFLIMLSSGLRIGEVMSLRSTDIDFKTNLIDASNIHKGKTKSSWISFLTKQSSCLLQDYLKTSHQSTDSKIFCISSRIIQQDFKKASGNFDFTIKPHLLRTIFVEKCTQANIPDKYIDAFCGRTPQSILAKNYTDYSPISLRKQYNKVEPYLTLKLS